MMSVSPWLVLAGLGAFHGVNPAMGWLFAVALGLHRKSRAVVVRSLLPIAIGHAVSIAIVAATVLLLGLVVDERLLEIAAGLLLIGWAAYHAAYGHRHRVRVGMTTGMVGLGAWSFLMATAHGAGLMLVPVLIPLCLAATPARELTASGSLPVVFAAIGTHMAAMLAVILVISVSVYEWVGLSNLRRGWINFDLIWIAALVVTGIILIA
ncbi:hypothetical protein KEU06_22180 [Pseudaminobacter sp. 19-2017]|uniref:Arginine/ornithine antiporter ArcD n=1 Tax=Pseudaminobacter soli (ex Zhang et al. 2022) TaxID=2831468 RepID=A0A942E5G0_9HYPH|nr:hypothetical protein [Pseudaminobacter soli]MBS3651326.1 hypothetical protein [Pseudaminobacter soli]